MNCYAKIVHRVVLRALSDFIVNLITSFIFSLIVEKVFLYLAFHLVSRVR
jgi:hypothetical protein